MRRVFAETILIAMTANELNPKLKISARIDEESGVSKLRRIGVENIVLPSQIGGRRLVAYLKQPAIVDFLDLVINRLKKRKPGRSNRVYLYYRVFRLQVQGNLTT